MTPPHQERPVQQLNAVRDFSTEKTKAAVDEASLILKTVYWSVLGPRIVWMLGWGVENSDPKCAVRVENSAQK